MKQSLGSAHIFAEVGERQVDGAGLIDFFYSARYLIA